MENGEQLMKLAVLVAMALFLLAMPILARADTMIDNCTTLSTPGETYLLTADINVQGYTNGTTFSCILIDSSNITLNCQNNRVEGNNSNVYGIYILNPVDNVTVKNCIVNNWSSSDIEFDAGTNLFLINSTTTNSGWDGIQYYGNIVNGSIINCTSKYNAQMGIRLTDGVNSINVINNTANDNIYSGIWVYTNSINNNVINNTARNNLGIGIGTDTTSPNNTFIGNIIINNTANTGSGFLAGLQLDSANNTAYNNIIQDNYRGIETCGDYDGNLIYNNILNNSMENGYPSIFCGNLSNAWNTTQQSGTRIYSAGTEIGGNYWTNSTANGYSDTCTDADTDGFCDSPYDVETGLACTAGVDCGNNTDYLPLSQLYEEPECIPSWNCTAWSACIRGYQTRDCTDDNKCGDNRTKPAESQVCFVGLPNATFNITDSCCPISQYYCTNNETLVQLWNTSEGVSWAVAQCAYGCDNVTSSCSPAPYEANIWTLVIIIVIIAAIAVLYRWSRR